MYAIRQKQLVFALCLAALLCAPGCSKRASQEPEVTVEERLASSLHGTARGIEYCYESAQGGFETLTGVPYDDLQCKSCHVQPGACETCHGSASAASNSAPNGGTAIAPSQNDEDCYGCHGDGRTYNSLHEPGAMTTRCGNADCHETLTSNEFHEAHAGASPAGAEMECAACHVQSVVTCYNCHFEYEVQGYGKLAFGQFKNWKFLLRRDRGDGRPKIDVGNMLTATYQGKAFVAIAPYYAHTVSKSAVHGCDDCHDNDYVKEYNDTGKIVIASWNEAEGALVPNIKDSGIIPIPPDWRTSLVFSFATFDDQGPEPPHWVKLVPSEVGMQMLFAEPLEELPD